jgi:hypothetical protein
LPVPVHVERIRIRVRDRFHGRRRDGVVDRAGRTKRSRSRGVRAHPAREARCARWPPRDANDQRTRGSAVRRSPAADRRCAPGRSGRVSHCGPAFSRGAATVRALHRAGPASTAPRHGRRRAGRARPAHCARPAICGHLCPRVRSGLLAPAHAHTGSRRACGGEAYHSVADRLDRLRILQRQYGGASSGSRFRAARASNARRGRAVADGRPRDRSPRRTASNDRARHDRTPSPTGAALAVLARRSPHRHYRTCVLGSDSGRQFRAGAIHDGGTGSD